MMRRGQVATVAAVLTRARTLDGWQDRRAAEHATADREAYEERAAIMEYLGNVPRARAESMARVCIARIPGAV